MKIVLLTLLATLFIQLGYFLWKLAADALPRIGQVSLFFAIKGFLGNWKWLLGLFLAIVGWVLFIKATNVGAISLVQPLMSVGDLFLVLLAVIFLHERLVPLEWVGLFLTVIGAVGISLEAKVLEPVAIDWFRILVFILLAVVASVSLFLLGKRKRQPEIFLGIAVGLGFGLGAVLTKLMTSSLTISGQRVAFVTCVFNPIFPFIVAANVAGLTLLQMAFQKGRAAVIIPVQLSVLSGVAVLGGLLLFSEVVSIYRLTSILLIVSGAVLLQYSGRDKQLSASA